jgi:O-antigen/teichoic acid export membrane protein
MSLRKNTLYNLAGALGQLGIALITVPLYLARIGTARYGVLALVWILLGYFGLFDLGLSRATSNRVARLETAPDEERGRVFWTAVLLNAALGLLGGVVLYAVARPLLGSWIAMPPTIRREALEALPWLIVAVPIATVTGVMTGALEGRRRFGAVNAAQLGGSLLFQVIPLVVAYTVGNGLEILIPVAVAARIVSAIPLVVLVVRGLPLNTSPRFEKSLVRPLLGYGAWVTVSGIVSPILTSIDRFVIGALRGASAITFYTVPAGLTTRASLLPGALARAIFPNFSSVSSTEAAALAEEAVRTFNAIMIPIVVFGLWALRPFLVLWLGGSFAHQAEAVGEILLLGIWINSLAFIPYALLQAQGRPDLTARFHLLEVIPFLAVLWGGLRLWGLPGAALAWDLRVTADAILLFLAAGHKELLRSVFRSSSLFVVASFLGVFFFPSLPLFLQAGLACVFFTAAALWALRTSPRLRHEIGNLRAWFRSAK